MYSKDVNCRFPNPPKFKGILSKNNFEVPKYYGYDHPCTKWILGSIVSNQALFRLLKVATSYQCILKRYHQIPDRPCLITKNQNDADRAAYNNQAILYLTPLAISIYMKYEDALTQLAGLKDSNGDPLINPNDLCFVQNFWRKGDTRYFTDLIATFPAIIALRRNYFIAFRYLLMVGYNPNDSFSITYRKPHREIIVFYKDLIDYVMDYMKRRPALNVCKLMDILLQPNINGSSSLDIFCFDYLQGKTPNVISLFHRITNNVLNENFSEENGMHIINILEKLQEAGYFLGFRNISSKDGASFPNVEDLMKENKGNKLPLNDLQKLKSENIENMLKTDYNYCIANMIIWLQGKSLKRKTEQSVHLLRLLVKIMFDTKLIEIFFKTTSSTNEDLQQKLSELPNLAGNLELKTIEVIMNHVNLMYQQSDMLISAFISRYQTEPANILLGFGAKHQKLKINNFYNQDWIKTELAEQNFRTKYLKNKTDSAKSTENRNKSNSKKNLFDNKSNSTNSYNSTVQRQSQLQKNRSNSGDCFNRLSTGQKYKSISSNSLNAKTHKKTGHSTNDFSIESAGSIDFPNHNDTISVSNILDLKNLTTIEIDLAEIQKSKRMYSEVIIGEGDEDKQKNLFFPWDSGCKSTGVPSSSRLLSRLPPPLKESVFE